MREYFKETQGYVLISTLFFLMLSGLFSHSAIQVSSNYLLQLRQLSTAYEVKAALNMSETLLQQAFETEETPSKGVIHTSAGKVNISGKEELNQIVYRLTLVKENGDTYQKEVALPIVQPEE